jgi:hypothetical protein
MTEFIPKAIQVLDCGDRVVFVWVIVCSKERDFLPKRLLRSIPIQAWVTGFQVLIKVVLNDKVAGQKVTEQLVIQIVEALPSDIAISYIKY